MVGGDDVEGCIFVWRGGGRHFEGMWAANAAAAAVLVVVDGLVFRCTCVFVSVCCSYVPYFSDSIRTAEEALTTLG